MIPQAGLLVSAMRLPSHGASSEEPSDNFLILQRGFNGRKTDQPNLRTLRKILNHMARCNDSGCLSDACKSACPSRRRLANIVFEFQESNGEVAGFCRE